MADTPGDKGVANKNFGFTLRVWRSGNAGLDSTVTRLP